VQSVAPPKPVVAKPVEPITVSPPSPKRVGIPKSLSPTPQVVATPEVAKQQTLAPQVQFSGTQRNSDIKDEMPSVTAVIARLSMASNRTSMVVESPESRSASGMYDVTPTAPLFISKRPEPATPTTETTAAAEEEEEVEEEDTLPPVPSMKRMSTVSVAPMLPALEQNIRFSFGDLS
jgi:hypothetical protein